ncbi:hypothetical protein ACQPUY_17440 [Clostridium nigeriense]
MNKEDKIIELLEKILDKLDSIEFNAQYIESYKEDFAEIKQIIKRK